MKACPRKGCKGQMEKRGDVWVCLQCSHEWQSPHQRNKYLEANKDDIVKDFYNEGTASTLKKWRISQAGWFCISRRWGLKKINGQAKITSSEKLASERDELIFLRGYKRAINDLIQGGVDIKLRIIDNKLVLDE